MKQQEKKIVIVIPTYNERGNVESLCVALREVVPSADILFIDDNSPDGTGHIIDSLSEKDKKIRVIHRNGRLGIGSAHQCGIHEAYLQGYDLLVTMDADFTHSPGLLPEFLNRSETADVVVGSRFLQADSLTEWNFIRLFLTKSGHFLTKKLLNLRYDATGALRVYRLDKIPESLFLIVRSGSYSFFFESLFILHNNGITIHEIPIRLPKRTYGSSKMRMSDILYSLSLLFVLFIKKSLFSQSLHLQEETEKSMKEPEKI